MPDVIVNLGGTDEQTTYLAEKIRRNRDIAVDVPILKLGGKQMRANPSEEEQALFARVGEQSRIYLLDHSCPNSEYIGGKHYVSVGDYFAKRIPHETFDHGKGVLTFSLIACHSSYGQGRGEHTFAVQFHRYLGLKYKWPTKVIGRNRVVTVNGWTPNYGKGTMASIPYGMGKILPWSLYAKCFTVSPTILHQVPGTKTAVVWSPSGHQVAVDAYLHSVYSRMMKGIQASTQVKESMDVYLDIWPEELDYETVKKLLREAATSIQEDDDALESAQWVFQHATDARRSLSPVAYRCMLKDHNYQSPNQQIQKRYFAPIVRNLRRLPKTAQIPESGPVKEHAQKFAQALGDLAMVMKTRGVDETLVRDMLRMLKQISETLAESESHQVACRAFRAQIAEAQRLMSQDAWANPVLAAVFSALKDAYLANDAMGLFLLMDYAEGWHATYCTAAKAIASELAALEQAGLAYLDVQFCKK